MELAYVLTLYLINMKEISILGHSNFLRTQYVDKSLELSTSVSIELSRYI